MNWVWLSYVLFKVKIRESKNKMEFIVFCNINILFDGLRKNCLCNMYDFIKYFKKCFVCWVILKKLFFFGFSWNGKLLKF